MSDKTEIERLRKELELMQQDWFAAEKGCAILRKGLEQMSLENDKLYEDLRSLREQIDTCLCRRKL